MVPNPDPSSINQPLRPPAPSTGKQFLAPALLAGFAVSIAGIATGIALLAVSVEPDTDYVQPEPWLVALGPGRFGAEFVTYGRTSSAVRFGVLDGEGAWIVSSRPITPSFGFFHGPSRAYAASDATRVHVAWTLYDSDRFEESFHYVQLDFEGNLRAVAGPLAATPVQRDDFSVYPQTPGIRILPDTVQVHWAANGTPMKTVLDLDGRVVAPPTPTDPLDNATGPPARWTMSPEDLPDASASVIEDPSGVVYYLWRRYSYSGSPRSPKLDYNVMFRRTGAGSDVERLLYSTTDLWWSSKPFVVPAIVLISGGGVATVLLGFRTFLSKSRRSWGR